MDKIKNLFFQINAKVPIIQLLFGAALLASVYVGVCLKDVFAFEPNLMLLYGLEDAGAVRARVEEQIRRYKPKPPPPPAPAPQMSYEVRLLRQHNVYLPPGVIESGPQEKEGQKITDVQGIDLVGTVYSYTPTRRSALIELNGSALVVLEGKFIRGTQKKVVEIGRSRITVQEEGLLPAQVHLAHEYGLDDLSQALATNVYKTKSNWDYEARSSGGKKVKPQGEEEPADGTSEDKGAKADKHGKKANKDAAVSDGSTGDEEPPPDEEEETDEESTDEPASGGAAGGGGGGGGGAASGGGGGGGVDIGGGE